jgi:hypothetical protein
MSSRRDTFYAERDKRTVQYGGVTEALERPVLIVVGSDAAGTRAGQVAALALVNMAARVHRRIGLRLPVAPLAARSLIPAHDLQEAAIKTARAINPVLDIDLNPGAPTTAYAATAGLGRQVPDNLDLYLDWQGGRGTLATSPNPPGVPDADAMFVSATASILGAAALFRLVHNQPIQRADFNPLELTSDAAHTRDHTGPIDVGDVLTVGAGAVTSALLYWIRELRPRGSWDVVDGDDAVLHNTNRCLTMIAADAGWPAGEPTGMLLNKAIVGARAIGGRAHTQWYDQWQPNHEARHDLVLPLANGRDVRTLIAQRGEPLLLHATTSPHWTAELHRHLPGRDDCPTCRIPDNTQPRLACSTGPAIPDDPDSPDAALPFLSAAAGLLLAAALAELPEGAALQDRFNHWQLDLTFGTSPLRARQHPPRQGCRHQQPSHIRQAVQRNDPRRWDYLDQGSQGR